MESKTRGAHEDFCVGCVDGVLCCSESGSQLFSSDYKRLPAKQVHILGVGLAVHEKLVHPEMRPLHKKLVDQFHMMRTGLHHVSGPFFFRPLV